MKMICKVLALVELYSGTLYLYAPLYNFVSFMEKCFLYFAQCHWFLVPYCIVPRGQEVEDSNVL